MENLLNKSIGAIAHAKSFQKVTEKYSYNISVIFVCQCFLSASVVQFVACKWENVLEIYQGCNFGST